ncbi:MAG: AAA family ATPase [Oscillospiraceae bacterium]|nr:AAA family ATPase [Oscillospiraceae bacterium]
MEKNLIFTLEADSYWVLKHRGDDELPVKRIAALLQEKLEINIHDITLTKCRGTIQTGDKEAAAKAIFEIVASLFPEEEGKGIFQLTVNESETTEEADDDEEETDAPDAEGKQPVFERIEALVGVPEFQELADECRRVAPVLRRNDTVDTFTSRSYLLSVNDGYGLSTILVLFADLIEELELYHFAANGRIVEVRIPAPSPKSGDDPFAQALTLLDRGAGRGRLICIDISEWMDKTSEKEFRDFLRELEFHTGENILFFRVPFVENNVLEGLYRDLNDQLYIRKLSIVPFGNAELETVADRMIRKKGFTMQADAWEVFRERLAEEKNDGRFYGINTVRKVVCEMLYRKQLKNAIDGEEDTLVKGEEILSLIANPDTMERTGMEMLDALVGMDEVKKQLLAIIAQIEAALEDKELETPCIHMRFVGNPGTGKTTVARILGKVLKERGILRNGSFFEYGGRDFCGRYVGETAPKTAAMCRDAYGSVLFIDEAYSLYRDENISTNDFGREAIDTLIAEMENHRTDLLVIMAGYTDDMERLMKGNIGLKSRMPYQIEFPNYTREQLYEIYISMIGKTFTYDQDFADAVKAFFDKLPTSMIEKKEFSNGRYVRNLFERTWGKAVLRCQMAGEKCRTLKVEDFTLAASDKDFQEMMDKKKQIGFTG